MKITLRRIFFVLLTYCTLIPAKNQVLSLDSLQHQIATQKDDTAKVNSLNAACEPLIMNGDTIRAQELVATALSLARRLKFKVGEAKALQIQGLMLFNKAKYPEALENYAQSLKLFKEEKSLAGVANINSSIGITYQVQYKFQEARQHYMLAIETAKQLGDKKIIADSYLWLGSLEFWLENFPAALKNYYLALKLDEELGYKSGMAFIYQDIGYVYYNMGNYKDALSNHLKSLKLSQELGNRFGQAMSIKNIGDVYLKMLKYDAALKNELEALKIFQETGFRSWKASAHLSIGIIHERLGDSLAKAGDQVGAKMKYNLARENYLIADTINEETQFNVYESSLNLGNIYLKLGEFNTARKFLDKSLELTTKLRLRMDIGNAYQSLSRLDSVQGNFREAFDHYRMYILYRDSVHNDENTNQVTQARLEYEFDKKEAVAMAEQQRKAAEARQVRNLQYFAIAIVVVIAIFLYFNSRQKQKAKTKIERAYSELKMTQARLIQTEKMASLGELTAGIAHEIENPLNFVNNFSEVNKELIGEMVSFLEQGNAREAIQLARDIAANEEKITHHGHRADGIVKSMLEHSRSGSGKEEATDINALADEYLRMAYHGLKAKNETFNTTLRTDFDPTIGKINIVRQDIGRVILNLVSNAFYAVAEKDKLQPGNAPSGTSYEPIVSLITKRIVPDRSRKERVEIRVSDNGMGIPKHLLEKIFQPFFTTKPTGQGTGLGLSLSYDIVRSLGGELKVETIEGSFAEFIIELPLK